MKLFRKNELTFALVMIAVYVIGSSMMQRISETVGTEFLAETFFCIIMSAALLIFIKHNGLPDYLGLKKPDVTASSMLFYVPLALVGGIQVFFGLGSDQSVVVIALHTIMMICVGFLEEVIFRGLLFRSIAKQNLTRGVVISSLTFAAGHIVNLLNGSNIFENTCQVLFAAAVGFMLVFIFLRTGSIVPCIIFHAFNNSLTAFTTGDMLIGKLGEKNAELVILAIKIIIATAYLFYISRLPKKSLPA